MISRVYSQLLLIPCMEVALLGLDHSAWDALLKQHVNSESRVDYRSWKQTPEALDDYLQMLAQPWPGGISGDERKAALTNGYNALTVRWILRHYPVESIWKTKKPFTEARHTLNGAKVSLDAIESELRKADPRIHSALVCAARSCPPLRREAYTASRVSEQLDDNTRVWLAAGKLNEFNAAARKAKVSSIFKWYGSDFAGQGLRAFLAKYAPAGAMPEGDVKIEFQRYHWGLNDQGTLGERYSGGAGMWFDYLRNK